MANLIFGNENVKTKDFFYFFLKIILWIAKNVVPLHPELRAYACVAFKNAFFITNLGG